MKRIVVPGRRAAAVVAITCITSLVGTRDQPSRVFGAPLNTSQPVTVTVDPAKSGATLPGTAIGINTAVWDGHLQDAAVPGLLHNAGTQVLRFPGGSTSDAYHWQTNSLTPGQGGYANPANTFDNFMHNVAQPAHAQPMITVNYGSNTAGTGGGDPTEAANWVNYANNVQHYGIKLWEVGNEVYGNGYYGSAWETDLHSDHSPTAYAANAVAFSQAMKAADPTVQVGLVVTAPGNWPDGQGPQLWNPTVLSHACQAADFVSVHWYAQSPGSETDSGLLSSTGSIKGMVNQLRAQLSQYCGARAAQIGIMVTESNSVSYNPGKQTTTAINGLFLLQNYMEWLQAGVSNVTWWDLHNGASYGNNNSGSLAGSTTYGDYGILGNGDVSGIAVNSPLPAYSALQAMHAALAPGSHFIAASSPSPDVHAYALQQPNGRAALVMVNASSSASYTVTPSISGWTGINAAQVTGFDINAPQATTLTLQPSNGGVAYTLPPYSAAVLVLTPATASGTPVTTSTPTPNPATSPSLMLGDFEGSAGGWNYNSGITSLGTSTWSPSVASGNSSLWTQYAIRSAWSEVQLYKAVNVDLSGFNTLSASVFPKQPVLSGVGVKVRFLVQGSDGKWYSSPYQVVPTGTRTSIHWNMSAVPRQPMRNVYVCWQFTTAGTGGGNEMWVDAIQALIA